MATIKDISRETGLGLATVSKYLNGGTVRPENKILLQKTIERLGYTMNNTARALKTNKTKMVGIVIPELSNLFMTTILTEVEDILRKNGYGVLVTDCRSNSELEHQSVEFLLSKQVDGIINVPVSSNAEHLLSARERGIPVVLVDRQLPIDYADFIGVDNILAGEMATELLLNANHKNIAIISGPENLSTAKDRVIGYKNALKKSNVKVFNENIINSDFTIESGYQSMKKLISTRQDITAVFTTNYEITVGAIIALNELSVKLPKQLSVVGFDNIELSRVINPKLTIVAQPITQIAITTATTMLARLQGEDGIKKTLLNPYVEKGRTIRKITT